MENKFVWNIEIIFWNHSTASQVKVLELIKKDPTSIKPRLRESTIRFTQKDPLDVDFLNKVRDFILANKRDQGKFVMQAVMVFYDSFPSCA